MSHVAELTTVTTTLLPGQQTAREAYDARRHRLRESGTKHTADPKALTLTWVEDENLSALSGVVNVSLTYHDDTSRQTMSLFDPEATSA